jgi:poly [ADP-ribose] polymerase
MYETGSGAVKTQYLLSLVAASASQPPPPANGSKKRTATASPPPTGNQCASQAKKPKIVENAKIGDGQNSKSKIAVSVDEYCPLSNYQVYIDPDGLVWDASLNQTSASANSKCFILSPQAHVAQCSSHLCD